MPIILVCSSVYAESCIVIARNWEFFKTSELCLETSARKASILFKDPMIYHVKPLCQEIILDKDT